MHSTSDMSLNIFILLHLSVYHASVGNLYYRTATCLYQSRVTATPYTARGTPERSERNLGMSDSPYHHDVTKDPKSSAKCRPHGDVSTCISTNLCHSWRQRLREVFFFIPHRPDRLLDEVTRHLVPFKTGDFMSLLPSTVRAQWEGTQSFCFGRVGLRPRPGGRILMAEISRGILQSLISKSRYYLKLRYSISFQMPGNLSFIPLKTKTRTKWKYFNIECSPISEKKSLRSLDVTGLRPLVLLVTAVLRWRWVRAVGTMIRKAVKPNH
jgi:hypothetical protein